MLGAPSEAESQSGPVSPPTAPDGNENDAFVRRDSSPLTSRKRVLGDTIGAKGRKTYRRMLVGFVNVNANKAKCSAVAASRV